MIQEFEPNNKVHVQWLKKLLDADIDKKLSILEKNPMNKEIPAYEVIHIMFALSMMYTKAVFNNSAHILD